MIYNSALGRLQQAEEALVRHTDGLPDSEQTVPLTTLYAWNYKTNAFQQIGYSCMLCGATWRSEKITKKHPYRCTKLKKKEK